MEAPGGSLLEWAAHPSSSEDALSLLSDPVRVWFLGRHARATLAQRLAWPVLNAGKNLLVCSPTGSGKTLAALLPVISRLIVEPRSEGIKCLYIAPLKALTNDIQRTLECCVQGIKNPTTAVRVAVRTGDTPPSARRHFRERPPDILLTTPESLAVLLTQICIRDLFSCLRWVVLDEVHALAGNKRGADVALSLERLQEIAGGSVQRIGLSATCAPLVEFARFMAGARRPCTIAHVPDSSPLHLTVEPLPETGGFMARLLDRLQDVLKTQRTTLVFTNTRALAERLSWALTRRFPEWARQIAVHHSAIDSKRRQLVERQLKRGRLRAVISSASLELGIDIGTVDMVVLVHPPGGVIRMLQRVGRSGHGPDRPRQGLVLTASPAELLEAAVTGVAGQSGQWENVKVLRFPLDVVCQQLLGMATQGEWSPPTALNLIRRAYPFHDLPEADFNDCLNYLSGLDKNGASWLPSRLRWQDGRFTILNERTTCILRRNLGTIIAEEPRAVRLTAEEEDSAHYSRAEAMPKFIPVGQVDEQFADQLHPGDRFLLDGRCWEVRRAGWDGILVREAPGRPLVPRWGGEGWPLSSELAAWLYTARVRAAETLRDGPLVLIRLLSREYGLEETAARVLLRYFQRQECASEIPGPTTCLIEAVANGFGADYYVHTPLNRQANDALARIAVRRLTRKRGGWVTSLVADLGFMLTVEGTSDLTPKDFRTLFAAEELTADLRSAVAGSVTLRERFRQVALIGFMILRNPLGGRRRVGGSAWPERRLYDKLIAADADFVLSRQAMREVCNDGCAVSEASQYAARLAGHEIHLRHLVQPSPFAENWTQAIPGPAEIHESPEEALTRLHASLTRMHPGSAILAEALS